jgi:hypothetical protein
MPQQCMVVAVAAWTGADPGRQEIMENSNTAVHSSKTYPLGQTC